MPFLPNCPYRCEPHQAGYEVFWIFAIAMTATASAALYYAARARRVNASAAPDDDATTAHFRLLLKEIEADTTAGRLHGAEADAARAELAREMLRSRSVARPPSAAGPAFLLPGAILLTAVLALGTYALLGNPGLPAQPLAERTPPGSDLNLDEALARIEAQLQKTPDDVRGWLVLAPVYMQQGRFADAANAYRQVIALNGPTADLETNLGEALMMAAEGNAAGEPLQLFESAAARDAEHIRSRYYLASDAAARGDYEAAIGMWSDLIAKGTETDPWLASAQAGLAAAQAGLAGGAELPDDAAIRGMVDGLAARLDSEGGSVEEWTRLVRSRLVLGQVEQAQQDYEQARLAYPDPAIRQELDVLAADNGLISPEGAN